MTDIETYINDTIRPKLQGDGGEILYASETEHTLSVVFRGECSKCMILDRCVDWIRSELLRETGREVAISYKREKPFFWR